MKRFIFLIMCLLFLLVGCNSQPTNNSELYSDNFSDSIVYENIIFALGVKAICLILGAMGLANMWLAIFADVGVMVIAVLNAVRCLQVKE